MHCLLRGAALARCAAAVFLPVLSIAPVWAQTVSLAVTPSVRVTGAEPYRWANAPLGGVEYATGLIWQPRCPRDVYLRADTGGIWKLDRNGYKWRCLTDTIPFKWAQLMVPESFGVDPDDPQTLYLAGGTGTWGQIFDVLKTTDGGKTWARTHLTTPDGKEVMAGGNDSDKQGGERLSVDPNDGRVIFYGTRRDGLFVSRDRAATWQPVASFPTKGAFHTGLTFVTYDWQAGKKGTASLHLWVGVHAGERDGHAVEGAVYQSRDGGQTWLPLPAGPDPKSSPLRGRVSGDGSLYVTYVGGAGVWKFKDGQWSDVTPPDGRGHPFCGINVDPKNPRRIVCAETYGQETGTLYYSADAGATWTTYRSEKANPTTASLYVINFVPWETAHGPFSWGGNASDVTFDPLDPTQILHLSFSGPNKGTGAGTKQMRFTHIGEGREQITAADVVSPSGGASLLSGVWDVGGFRHVPLGEIPHQTLQLRNADGSKRAEGWENGFQDIFDMDAAPRLPDAVVACGGWQWNQTGTAAVSLDNGQTFRRFAGVPFADAKFGRIALSATDAQNIVWAPLGDEQTPVYATRDGGKTWQASSGAPRGMVHPAGPWTFYKCLAADRESAGTFYLYDRRDGGFYASTDGGLNFARRATLPTQPGNHYDLHRLEAAPGHAGDVWLALQEQGLLHTTDGGKTWQRLDGVRWAQNVAFGKGKTNAYPAVYLFGQIGGSAPKTQLETDADLFRSDDGGRTWVKISDMAHRLGSIGPGLAGDMQTWGRVYLATSTRGIFYGERRAKTPVATGRKGAKR